MLVTEVVCALRLELRFAFWYRVHFVEWKVSLGDESLFPLDRWVSVEELVYDGAFLFGEDGVRVVLFYFGCDLHEVFDRRDGVGDGVVHPFFCCCGGDLLDDEVCVSVLRDLRCRDFVELVVVFPFDVDWGCKDVVHLVDLDVRVLWGLSTGECLKVAEDVEIELEIAWHFVPRGVGEKSVVLGAVHFLF